MKNTDSQPTKLVLDSERATLVLPLPKGDFLTDPVRAAISSFGLNEKEDLHLTVVGFDTGERLREIASDAAERLAVLATASADWQVTPLPRFLYIEKDEELGGEPYRRQSLIQECAAPELERFYAELAARFGEAFPVPYPHVTLGTNSNIESRKLRGIGIYSRDDLAGMDVVREVEV